MWYSWPAAWSWRREPPKSSSLIRKKNGPDSSCRKPRQDLYKHRKSHRILDWDKNGWSLCSGSSRFLLCEIFVRISFYYLWHWDDIYPVLIIDRHTEFYFSVNLICDRPHQRYHNVEGGKQSNCRASKNNKVKSNIHNKFLLFLFTMIDRSDSWKQKSSFYHPYGVCTG